MSFRPTWPTVQPASPAATDGLIVVPAGSVTSAVFRFACAIPVGFWGWGTLTSTEIAVGLSELVAEDCTSTVGSKGTSSHPSAPTGVVELRCSKAPFCHELARRRVVTGPTHEVGLVRNGSRSACDGQRSGGSGGLVGVCRHAPRSSSCAGSAGTPQKVRLVPVSGRAWEMLGIVTRRPPSGRTEAFRNTRGIRGTNANCAGTPGGGFMFHTGNGASTPLTLRVVVPTWVLSGHAPRPWLI